MKALKKTSIESNVKLTCNQAKIKVIRHTFLGGRYDGCYLFSETLYLRSILIGLASRICPKFVLAQLVVINHRLIGSLFFNVSDQI